MIETGDNTINLSADTSGCGITIGDGGIWIDGARLDTIYQPKSYRWEPKEDITAYELAQCMPIVMALSLGFAVEKAISGLPDSCKRHFTEE